MPALLLILALIAVIPILAFYRAVCLAALYNWFLLPLGFPQIGTAHLYGITILLALAICHPSDENRKTSWSVDLLTPAMCVLFGWVTKTFFM